MSNDSQPNRNYKDTLFRMLFNNKPALLSLYNALFGTTYDDPDKFQIVTLENAIYMNYKNDIACLIDFTLTLFEHQSSVNPNMPLRFLQYIETTFNRLAADEDIYSSKLIRLPSPTFIVFYNGLESQPEKKVMRLSDAYLGDSTESDEVNLELKVIQLNINPGYNEDLKQKCPTLFGYAHFVSLVRSKLDKYKTPETDYQVALKKSVDEAVDECIKNNILSDFLKIHRKEVASMGLFDYDEEKHIRTVREEAFDEGRKEERNSLLNRLLADGELSPEVAEAYRKEAI